MHFRNCGMLKSALRRESQPRTKFSRQSIWPDSYFFGVRGWVVAVGLVLLTQVARAEDTCPRAEGSSPESNELICPPVCSPLKPIPPELKDYCKIETVPGTERHKIRVNLRAHRSEIKVGGYKVTTEHYNDSYLTPVIEALPGDTVAAHLENSLPDLKASNGGGPAMAHGDVNPTNLHYFHGGIVTPNNARPKDARKGDGDNIYVWLKNGADSKPFAFNVPVPGDKQLDARVLEGKEGTFIPHPAGLNWYHSHLHGISSDQVMGGMSGLLSVGEDKAAVKARCKAGTDPDKCKKDTEELQKSTIVRYAMLRDITIKDINALPAWAPEQEHEDFTDDCKVWKKTDSPGDPGDEDPKRRKGFCQRDQNSAWLFTLNGQRYPTITVADGKNLLLRLGNLSANVAYWLELVKVENESTETKFPLTVLSLDGVVPARPVDSEAAKIPVDALDVNELLLMPASRVEIYIRNDMKPGHPKPQVYVLRTKGLETGGDRWPEIQLARIVLEPSTLESGIALALNVPIERTPFAGLAALIIRPGEPIPPPPLPHGCVRDLKPGEHRRVTFGAPTVQGRKLKALFGVKTEIMGPPKGHGIQDALDEDAFKPDDNATVEASFEEYEQKQKDGGIDWEGNDGPNHVCIHIDNNDPDHKGSHKQLWVLSNTTDKLHNFHIHQMKFRLATLKDLDDHHITPPAESHTCDPTIECQNPDYKLYDDDPNPKTIWHDTIPMPPGKVFVIMSFDAPQQVGRFVYHCHILKHEDKGLMAPIEVWGL